MAKLTGIPLTTPLLRHRIGMLIIPVLLAVVGLCGSAEALVRLDFEQKYFQHPDRQVWDFSIIRADSVYHIFYHTIHEDTPSAAAADTIWHSTSPDLRHWTIEGPILITGQGSWDSAAMWAPDVFRDEENNRWGIAYTGCDSRMNQRISFAFSEDLFSWTKSDINPTIVPDTNQYVWNPDSYWSNFRDPFLYRQDGQWHILVTALQQLGTKTGVLYHATSSDLETWQDEGIIFAHDGLERWRVLESPQYFVSGDYHHLLFGEYDTPGVTVITNDNRDDWSMAERTLLDYGYAPEIDMFDSGHRIYSRLAPYQRAGSSELSYVVRLDSLRLEEDDSELVINKPHPLDADWPVHTGVASLGNPIFEDNPLWRGEPSVGLVGHGYFGSKEYYQGPLSGRGGPGTSLGESVTGLLESHPFIVTGQRMDLLVGGGEYPATCYVALVDLADTTIIYSETGMNDGLMSPRQWDLVPHQGKECIIRILDDEAGPFGYINVDEIIEIYDVEAPSPPTSVVAFYTVAGVDLDWDDAPENDFHSHRIYRSQDPDFVPGAGNLLGEITTSAWADSTSPPWDLYYKVTTVDLLGNESLPGFPSELSDAPLPGVHTGNLLADAVPNPFNPVTRLDFEIARTGSVRLRIFDLAGRLVTTLVDRSLPAGNHSATWNGQDSGGRHSAAGVYFYRLETADFTATRRMTLLK